MVIDFHGHWFPPHLVGATPPSGLPPALTKVWPLITDIDAQLEAAAAAGTDVKVVCAPLSSITSDAGRGELVRQTNDVLAQEVSERDGRLQALATVDPYAGDAGAEEARRAVEELGLPGIVVDAARGEVLLSDPSARATLEYASQAGVPVFAHPVNPPVLPPRYANAAGFGTLLARGSESALSTLSLLACGTLEELPGLKLVVAGIGSAALTLAAFLDGPEDREPLTSAARSRLFIDTMGFDPAVIRFALDVLGPEQVLVGSDWPIMWREPSSERVEQALTQAGALAHERELISSGNSARLLGLEQLVA